MKRIWVVISTMAFMSSTACNKTAAPFQNSERVSEQESDLILGTNRKPGSELGTIHGNPFSISSTHIIKNDIIVPLGTLELDLSNEDNIFCGFESDALATNLPEFYRVEFELSLEPLQSEDVVYILNRPIPAWEILDLLPARLKCTTSLFYQDELVSEVSSDPVDAIFALSNVISIFNPNDDPILRGVFE
jgi:hypothetical protein